MADGEITVAVITAFYNLYVKLVEFSMVVFGAIQEGLFGPWRRIALLSNLIENFRDLNVYLGQLDDGFTTHFFTADLLANKFFAFGSKLPPAA